MDKVLAFQSINSYKPSLNDFGLMNLSQISHLKSHPDSYRDFNFVVMAKEHQYKTNLVWAGNKGSGTMDYRSYDRDFVVSIENKEPISGSSDSIFLGDKTKYNPEDLLLASVSSCHMLWYLHLCSKHEIVVMEYKDNAVGTMVENADGSGQFSSILLQPEVLISKKEQIELANTLHEEANKMCFIANSLNFPVKHKPNCSAINA